MTGRLAEAGGPAAYAALLCCAGLAAWLLTERQSRRRRARLLFADSGGRAPAGRAGPKGPLDRAEAAVRAWYRTRGRRWLGPEWLCLPAGSVVARLGESPLPLIVAAVAVLPVRRRLGLRKAAGDRDRRAAEVIELCVSMSGGLRAGMQPAEALLAAPAGPGRTLDPAVTAAARYGGDVPAALRRAAGRPGAEGLAGVAACWRAAADTGAGLAAGLDRVAAALRAERDRGEDLRARLAAARASALILVVLPVLGLLLGSALGAEPLWVLLHTPAGLGCLVAGGLLEGAGLLWTVRITRTARTGHGGGRPPEADQEGAQEAKSASAGPVWWPGAVRPGDGDRPRARRGGLPGGGPPWGAARAAPGVPERAVDRWRGSFTAGRPG